MRKNPEDKELIKTLKVRKEETPTTYTFDVYNESRMWIAELVINKQGKIQHAAVIPKYRRKGIATWLYEYAEKETGLVLRTGSMQSPDAENLWKSFKERGIRNKGVRGNPAVRDFSKIPLLQAIKREKQLRHRMILVSDDGNTIGQVLEEKYEYTAPGLKTFVIKADNWEANKIATVIYFKGKLQRVDTEQWGIIYDADKSKLKNPVIETMLGGMAAGAAAGIAGAVIGSKMAQKKGCKNPGKSKLYSVFGTQGYSMVKVGNYADKQSAIEQAKKAEISGLYSKVSIRNNETGEFESTTKTQKNPGKGNHFRMAEKFHGRRISSEIELEEVVQEDLDLGKLGILTEIEVLGKKNVKVPIQFADIEEGTDYLHLDEDMDEYVSLCTNGEGNQLYFEGGDQDLEGCLKELKAAGCEIEDKSRFVLIGTVDTMSYFGDKHHLSGPKQQKKGMHYIHELGEETGVKPMLVFDKLQKRISFIGGDYRVEDIGIVN